MQRADMLAAAVGFALFAMPASVAFAVEVGSGGISSDGSEDVSIQLSAGASARADDSSSGGRGSDAADAATDERGGLRGSVSASASASATSSVSDDGRGLGSGTSSDRSGGQAGKGEERRSAIASVVLSLRALADRAGGIGSEIREVAREQASSSEESARAIDAVEGRSALLTFLFGSDYKNLGVLRSTLATTQNHIDRLTKAKDRATSTEVKAGIDTQIAALAQSNADAEAFVQAHEETFSVFGWFAKLFQ